jgi:hypothetical protein
MMYCLRFIVIGIVVLLPRWVGRKGSENKIQLGVNLEALLMTWKWGKKLLLFVVYWKTGLIVDFLPRL